MRLKAVKVTDDGQGSHIRLSGELHAGIASPYPLLEKTRSSREVAESPRADVWRQGRRLLATEFRSDRRPTHLNAGLRGPQPYPTLARK